MKIKEKMSNALNVSDEIFLNVPMITLIGKGELTLENYKGIVLYSEEKIRINTNIGVLVINGNNLSLSKVLAEKITITGDIVTVGYGEI